MLFLSAGLLCGCLFSAVYIQALRESVGPSPACRTPDTGSIQAGTTTARTLLSGGIERCYLLHIPAGYDPARPLPLVVVLHGLASNGATIREVSGWDSMADQEGFLAAYPDGTSYPLRWNANAQMNSDADDVGFFRDLVAAVSETAAVDPKRVYVNGFSNGATMSIVLGCSAADQVAAIGLVDPGILTAETLEGCTPARAVPGIEFVGTGKVGMMERGDPETAHREFTPWIGRLLGVDADYLALPWRTWGDRWAELNGCDPNAYPIQKGDGLRVLRYDSCRTEGGVAVYIVDGMGHQWPSGRPWPSWLMGEPSQIIDATSMMWAFFSRNALD